MRFRKLRLTGFKSFVEPAELLIEPGLTGVVGPNGCGKSNLLEAIRWVMGEGSPKSLRGGGMEDVIFAGTASRPARDFAEVMLGIEDQDGEHDIVRRIERGTGSAYRIDGRDVRQRDVALLFADAATGAHSPALVSQGRVAAVIAAKPVERRQMLEEAAGIAGLHVRRREAELKLRATEANLMRLDELLGGMEARAGALRRQAKAAERYRALSSEIRLAEARSLFARWREAARAAEQGRAEADAAAQAVNTAAEVQRAGAAHLTQATAVLAEARHVAEKAREAAGEIRYRGEALQNEKTGIERRLAELAAQAIAVERDRMREDALAVDAAAALEQLVEEESGLAKAKTAAEKQRGPLDQAVIEAEHALLECEVQTAQSLARASAEQAELRVADAALAAARQQKARADADLARLADEIMGLGDEQALLAQRDLASLARSDAEARLSETTSQLTEAEAERDRASAAREAAETTSAAARAALATLESEARALRAALARETGTGVIASLTVDSGYERALAAALGDDLEAPLGADAGRGWVGASPQKGDPALPQGVQALGQHVRGDAALARRLAQVGVVENDAGQPLAVGQRLVTHAGALRRWDGFIARESGAAAAERLLRANRLTTLESLVGQAEIAVVDAAAVLAIAAERNGTVRAEIEKVRKQLAQAEGELSTARRDEDRTAHAIERREAAEQALNARRGVVEQAAREAAVGVTRAETAMATLPDGAASRFEVDRLGATTATARAQLVETRSRAFALAQGIANDERRIEAARGEAKGWRSRAGDAAKRIAEITKRTASIEEERASLAGRPAAIDADLAAVAAQSLEADSAAQQARESELARDADVRRLEGQATQTGEALATAREARAGAQARAEHQEMRRAELSQQSGERFDCPAAVLADKIGFEASSLAPAQDEAARHERLLVDRERLGPVNLVAASELAELEDIWTASACERDELGQAVNRLRGSIGSLNREGRQRLLVAFEAVDGHFRRLFTTLFAGGEAHLALIDSDDPLDAGLEIMAQPPGKKLGSLTLLSGGEQALTAIALIFALFLTNPAPICVLDEVDAPLDDANIERFCDLLTAMTRETDTRYLIVTHNAVTMSRMHRLFGVTMIERGISRLVSVDLGRAETLLAAE